MADGELTLKLGDEGLRRLTEAADAARMPLDDYARGLLLGGVDEDRWSESRRRLAEYDRTGDSMSVEEGLAAFDAAVEARFRAKT